MNPSNSKTILGAISEKIINFTNFGSKQDDINEVLFYGGNDKEDKKKAGLNNLFCIYYVIVHASQAIDICMPSLNSDTISKCLINVHRKKLAQVRIIVHDSDGLNSLKCIIDAGVEVKVINPEVKFEHEFILVDAEHEVAVAIIGSLDYEIKRVNCNNDNTLITSEATLILALKREFERIWNTVECVNDEDCIGNKV